jgi:hypothetical protein
MNRTTLLLIGAVIVVGAAAGLLLAVSSPSAPLQGALFDTTPGPWKYGAGTALFDPALNLYSPSQTGVGLLILEQRSEQVATTTGATIAADCYLASTFYDAEYWTDYWGMVRTDMIVLAGSVDSATVQTYTPSSVNGCTPTGVGVSSSTTDQALVGTNIVRNNDVSHPCNPQVGNGMGNAGYRIAAIATVAEGANQVKVFKLYPGIEDDGIWKYWEGMPLYAPIPYVRANYHVF